MTEFTSLAMPQMGANDGQHADSPAAADAFCCLAKISRPTRNDQVIADEYWYRPATGLLVDPNAL